MDNPRFSRLPIHTPLIAGDKTPARVTADICAPLERRAGLWWWLAFLSAFTALLVGIVAVSYQIKTGIGTWGLNRTVGWGFDIAEIPDISCKWS